MNQQPEPDPMQLIRAMREGDETACGKLLDMYRDYLRFLARMKLGARLHVKVDASDLVQETCLYAHKYFVGFRGTSEAELLAWLRSILADRAAKQVRRYSTDKRDMNLEQRLEHDLTEFSGALQKVIAADQTSPSERAVRREQSVLLANALEKLTPHYREVIVLHHVQGLPLRDVAKQLGRSHESVRKLWVRAMVKLRLLVKDPS